MLKIFSQTNRGRRPNGWRRYWTCLLAAGLIAGMNVGSSAQVDAANVPSYDVVSVKPNNSGTMRVSINGNDGLFKASNVTLLLLIQNAYGMKADLISGAPAWAASSRFDFEAKVAAADLDTVKKLKGEQTRVMLQRALEDRFQLKSHHETKTLPVYELVVAKAGLKMKQATPGDTYPNGMKGRDGVGHAGMMRMARGEVTCQGVDMNGVADFLYNAVGRKVIDKTGVPGTFDFSLKWTPDEGMGEPHDGDSGPTETLPGIFTALQEQLGLRLQPAKGPVETLVIDRAEKPVEN